MKLHYQSFFFIASTFLFIRNVRSVQLESASLIGGRETDPHEIKYLVSLQYDGEHFCGGSIIGDKHILTAAHCVISDDNEFDNRAITVVAGTNDLNDEDLEPIEVAVEKIYVPSHYNDSEWTNSVPRGDIAVLKLNQSLDLKYNMDLMKLHLPRMNKRYKSNYKTYKGDKVVISGFGWDHVKVKKHRNKTEYEVGSSTEQMFSANAEVISNQECQEYYRNSVHENELCARVIEHNENTPQGVCRGDSGGPLVYKSNTIIGVVSGISLGCNENNEPGIYCRVSSYITFIRNALKNITDNMRVKEFS